MGMELNVVRALYVGFAQENEKKENLLIHLL